MSIQVNPSVKTLRAAAPSGLEPERILCRRFRAFLRLYEKNRFLFLGETPKVVQSLKRMTLQFRELLRERYLGLALGGSLVRGLADPSEADVDYILFVGGVDPGDRELHDRIIGVQEELKEKGFKPCNLLHMHDLVHDVTFGPEVVASVFANYIIDLAVPEEKILQLVRQTIGRWEKRYDRRNFDLNRQIRESYRQLSGCDVMQVTAKYLEKRIYGADCGTHGGRLGPVTLKEKMVDIARPYLARREQNFPFPDELFSGETS